MNIKILLLIALFVSSSLTMLAETVRPIACNLKALTSEQRKQLEQLVLNRSNTFMY